MEVETDPLDIGRLEPFFGKELPAIQPWNNEPIESSEIRRYAYGFADYNPLYSDPAYGSDSRFGSCIAPPYFPYAIHRTVSSTLPEFSASDPLAWKREPNRSQVYGGTDWEFGVPIQPGDAIHVKERFLGAEEKRSKYAGRTLISYGETKYVNQRGDVVATAVASLVRFVVSEAVRENKYLAETAEVMYTPELIDQIESDRLSMAIRGKNPRFYEDVRVGDRLTPVVQGPLLPGEIVYFETSGRLGPQSSVAAYPRNAGDVPFAQLLAEDPWTHGHTNNKPGDTASGRALPAPFDLGMQRVCWLLRSVGDWKGDDADILSASVKITRPNFVGNVSWYGGNVTGKRMKEGAGVADLALSGHDQLGNKHAVGTATVKLPVRGGTTHGHELATP